MNDALAAHEWLRAHRDELVTELMEWVRIPSVVGPGEHRIDVVRSAQWLAGALRAMNFPTVELWDTEAGPAVWAEWCVAGGAPTVLVYSHHDVRSVKSELWEQCPPFEPVLRDGRVFGRGTSDAKGQVLAHLWGLRACLAAGRTTPPVNLKLLVEGEEEAGSPHLADILGRHAERLAADLIVFTDTMTWAADRPAVCTGIRGMMKARLELSGADADTHAGVVSGAAPNPATELAHLLAKLHDADGRVAIPGFYDDVREAPQSERAQLAQLGADEADWLARTGTRAVVGEAGRSLAERLYVRPAAEVAALHAGDPEGVSRGTIAATATAEIQLSLVPDQDPAKVGRLLDGWVRDNVPEHVAYSLDIADTVSQPAYATPTDHPALALLAESIGQAWDREPATMRNAGSGPAVLLADAVGAPIVFFGTGLPEDRWHAPDESVRVDMLLKGAAAMALFWPRLAERLTSPE